MLGVSATKKVQQIVADLCTSSKLPSVSPNLLSADRGVIDLLFLTCDLISSALSASRIPVVCRKRSRMSDIPDGKDARPPWQNS